jgi:hypothetical protein
LPNLRVSPCTSASTIRRLAAAMPSSIIDGRGAYDPRSRFGRLKFLSGAKRIVLIVNISWAPETVSGGPNPKGNMRPSRSHTGARGPRFRCRSASVRRKRARGSVGPSCDE